MYSISKEVYFCYGHRLMNHAGKCRHIHGHSVKATVTVSQSDLNQNSMVCDFADLKSCIEDFVDEYLDHNLLLYQNDPLVPILTAQSERFLTLTEHPTAEVLSKLIYQHVKSAGFQVLQVDLWETASAYASYRES